MVPAGQLELATKGVIIMDADSAGRKGRSLQRKGRGGKEHAAGLEPRGVLIEPGREDGAMEPERQAGKESRPARFRAREKVADGVTTPYLRSLANDHCTCSRRFGD